MSDRHVFVSQVVPGEWPGEIPGVGVMRGGQPFGRCAFCPEDKHIALAGTWVTYGPVHVCWNCAKALTREGGAEVEELLARAMGRSRGGAENGSAAGRGDGPITQSAPRPLPGGGA